MNVAFMRGNVKKRKGEGLLGRGSAGRVVRQRRLHQLHRLCPRPRTNVLPRLRLVLRQMNAHLARQLHAAGPGRLADGALHAQKEKIGAK